MSAQAQNDEQQQPDIFDGYISMSSDFEIGGFLMGFLLRLAMAIYHYLSRAPCYATL